MAPVKFMIYGMVICLGFTFSGIILIEKISRSIGIYDS